MRLHENPDLFSDAIQAASEFKGIREVYIEKDYWITFVLHTIFNSEYKNVAVFKGGTALSKCHGLIERFSEDVDIVVIREEGESNNQLSHKIRSISKLVAEFFPEKVIEGITSKHGQFRKTAHEFEKTFDKDYGQVRQDIILEVSSLGNYKPYAVQEVVCYIAEMMKEKGQKGDMIDEYNLSSFPVQVLGKDRTLCEKIMSLVRFSKSEEPYENLANKIRHIYDIHSLLADQETKEFFEEKVFEEMINKVGQDDIMSYRSGTDWLTYHPKTAIIYSEPVKTWVQLQNTYSSTFKDLVYGDLPEEGMLIETLKKIHERLSKISWVLERG